MVLLAAEGDGCILVPKEPSSLAARSKRLILAKAREALVYAECCTEFARCGASGFGHALQCFVATFCAFDDFAGDVLTGPMFVGPGLEDFACPFEGNFHIGQSPGIKAICNHGRLLSSTNHC